MPERSRAKDSLAPIVRRSALNTTLHTGVSAMIPVSRFKKLEGIIQEKENALKKIDEEIASVGTEDRTKMTDLSYQYETIQRELNEALEEWTTLGEKLV